MNVYVTAFFLEWEDFVNFLLDRERWVIQNIFIDNISNLDVRIKNEIVLSEDT